MRTRRGPARAAAFRSAGTGPGRCARRRGDGTACGRARWRPTSGSEYAMGVSLGLESRRRTPGRRRAGGTSLENAVQRFCLQSQNRPVAMSPQIWIPRLVRRPAEMMTSVHAGRIYCTAASVAIVRFGFLARPLFAGSLLGAAADIAIGRRPEAFDAVAVILEAATEQVGDNGARVSGNPGDRLQAGGSPKDFRRAAPASTTVCWFPSSLPATATSPVPTRSRRP